MYGGEFLLIALGGLIPSFIWWGILLTADRHPEQKQNLITTFLLGILTAIPVIGSVILLDWGVTELGISLSFNVRMFLTGALVEEVFKGLILYLFIFHRSFFTEPIDAFVYGITLALGFAAIENMIFIVGQMSAIEDIAKLAFFVGLRSLTAVVIHIVSTGVIAYGIYRTMYGGSWIRLLLSGILGVGIHGIYNLLLSETNTVLGFVNLYSVLVVIGGYILYRRVAYLQRYSEEDTHLDDNT